MSGILVGVDGSYHSRAALSWAVREAVRHHSPLTVMTVYSEPPRPATGIYWGIHNYSEESFDGDTTRKAVAQLADEVASETGERPTEITVNVARGMWPQNCSGPPATPTCSSWGHAAPAGSPDS